MDAGQGAPTPRSASPFTAAAADVNMTGTSSTAQQEGAAAAQQEGAAAAQQELEQHPSCPSLALELSELPTAAEGAAAAAAAVLPPRPPSLNRADSLLGRAGSLALRPLQPPSLAVWGWGRNDCGQLGLPAQAGSDTCPHCSNNNGGNPAAAAAAGPPGIIAHPTLIPALAGRSIVGAAASLFNSALLVADGELFVWGSNDSGLLARRPRAQQQQQEEEQAAAASGGSSGSDVSWVPVRVEALEPHPLAAVALGARHALAVTQQGLLASWGDNDSGQLGTGTTASDRPQHTPKLLRGSSSSSGGADGGGGSGSSGSSSSMRNCFVRAAAGEAFSVAANSSGRCFTFGQAGHGVLGLGADVPLSSVPQELPGLWEVAVTQVSAGEAHAVVLTSGGCVFTWGRGRHGALGHGDFEDQAAPRQVKSVSGIGSVAAGDQHTLLLAAPDSSSSSTVVYACGRGTFGATGLGSTDSVCRPCVVQALTGQTIVQISAGRQHSLALTAEGDIFTWGAGELGQLGLGCSSCSSSCNTSSSQAKQQQGGSSDVDMTAAAAAAAGGMAGSWRLPRAQLSPRRLQDLPWPRQCPVLFVCAGGDHNLVVVDMAPAAAATAIDAAGKAAPANGRSCLDVIAEVAAADVDGVEIDAAAAADGSRSGEAQQQQQQQAQQQQQVPCVPAAACGPQAARPHGAMFLPMPPPPLLELAKAAAAEAAAERRAAGVPSPEPHSKVAAAAAATNSSSSSNKSPPSALVVDLTHAVLDTFSSPGLLLQLFRASPQQQQQQQQQAGRKQTRLLPHGLDLEAIDSTYSLLLRSYRREVLSALGAAALRLIGDLPTSAGWASGCSPDVVALLLILLQCPLASDTYALGASLLGSLTVLVLKLNSGSLTLLMAWLGELRPEVFGARIVRPVQALLTRLCKEAASAAEQQQQRQVAPNAPRPPPGLGACRGDVLLLARLLDVLHTANVQAGEVIPYTEFQSAPLSATAHLQEEYFMWLQSGHYRRQFQAFQQAAHRATSADTDAAPLLQPITLPLPQQTQQQAPHTTPPAFPTQPSPGRRSAAAAAAGSPRRAGGGCELLVSGVTPGGDIASLCEVPFLLTTEAKSKILRGESSLQQQHVVHESAIAAIMQGLPPGGGRTDHHHHQQQQQQHDPLSLTLSLRVRRGHVLMDALAQIRGCGSQELKKPLRVTFLSDDGRLAEEGVDQGGVSREFFQLLVGQLFSPDYGMFLEVDESHVNWFNTASLESLDEFELVGSILGLACYNNVIVDAHLPLPAYKKLMGLTPSFDDLALLYPDLYSGLVALLEYEGDVEATFCRSFEVEYEAFGQTVGVELVPGGAHMPVTNANRAAFVQAYAGWLLGGAVREQFAAFASGFHRVCGGPALSLFRYEELELLVEGLPHLDFGALQAGARYEGGYSEASPTVQHLWSVLQALPLDEKRAFLQFATGCDRAPVAGLKALNLLVQRAGPDSDKLPTAHTCFNALLLPEYGSRDKLRSKLLTAIQNAQGFGLQ